MLRDPIIQNLFPEIFEFEEAVDVIGCLKEWPKSRLCDDKAIARKTKIDIKTVKDILKLLETKNFVYNIKVNEICIKIIKHFRSGKLSHEEIAKKVKLDVKIVDQFIEENESLLLETKKTYSQQTLKTLNDNLNVLIKGEKKEKEEEEDVKADDDIKEELEKIKQVSSEEDDKVINEDKESEEIVVKEAIEKDEKAAKKAKKPKAKKAKEEKSKKEKADKKRDQYVYVIVKDNGFEITDIDKNLLWTVEKKDSDYYLKKGPNKEFAYRFGIFKQKSSTVMDCYMLVDTKNNPKSISWKTDKGLYVMDANQNTKFYIPKCNPNSKNEPALAFPNLFLLEEMDIKLRNIIAIEMSQLE